jgi:hypothetical protein
MSTSTSEVAIAHDYKTMLRLARPFIRAKGFAPSDGYRLDNVEDWTPAQKGLLTRRFKELVEIYSISRVGYSSNDPAKMKAAEKIADQTPGAFSQAFIPAPPGSSINIDVATRTARAITPAKVMGEYKFSDFGLNDEQLALDPYGASLAVMNQIDAKKFAIKAGVHTVGKGVPRLYLAKGAAIRIRQLVEKYGADSHDANDTSSKYYGNWLFGVDGYTFRSMKDEQEFVNKTLAESTERRRIKRAARKRIRYYLKKYGESPPPLPKKEK